MDVAGDSPDVVLVGAGIMSATLATLLAEADPSLRMDVFERLEGVALESTQAMNNAGTGHAANCELNYTPEQADGNVDIAKAVTISESFEHSLAFWATLVERGVLPQPRHFIAPVPHMSFVWGQSGVEFLQRRHQALRAHPYFSGMEYTQDMEQLAEWAPLVVQGRDRAQEIAATRVTRGTDVDFGVLARAMFGHLQSGGRLRLHLLQEVTDLGRSPDGRWRVTVRDRTSASRRQISARFVFLGAGGGALPLLLRSGIPEGRGYGGFPVSGLWLVCNRAEVAERHQAKVYGKASVGAPPMSVPHLDTRHIDGRRTLLFGPFAGFSTKFLKAGSYLDLPRSLGPGNVLPMIGAGLGNAGLIGYLVGQVLQSPSDRMAALRAFMPTAEDGDWQLAVAGQRVQIIKKAPGRLGKLEFGTEVVAAGDGSIAALLGASPGASTAVVTMTDIVRRCFVADGGPDREEALRRIVPTLGLELPADGAQLARLRARNNEVLEIGG